MQSTTQPGRPGTKVFDKEKATPHYKPLEQETRPTVGTAAYAHYMHISPQSARLHACKGTGPVMPIRLAGIQGLHWPTDEIRRVLGVK